MERTKQRNPPQQTSQYFGVMLYPQEDPKHTAMMIWVKNHYPCIYITHDSDRYGYGYDVSDDNPKGSPVKSHVHLVYKLPTRSTASAQSKFFARWVSTVVRVESIQSYIMYMVHDTPDSMDKHSYSYDDLVKNDSSFDRIIRGNQLASPIAQEFVELMRSVTQTNTLYASDVLAVCKDHSLEMLDFALSHGSWIHQAVRDNQWVYRNIYKRGNDFKDI